MFAAPGNPVQAEESGDNSNDAFKVKKSELISTGYCWNGANSIEVVLLAEGVSMVGVPFTDQNGIIEVNVFINGAFVGTARCKF